MSSDKQSSPRTLPNEFGRRLSGVPQDTVRRSCYKISLWQDKILSRQDELPFECKILF
ncbi:hypothetical protein [uncultured Campylobacter sp.]|uniref:hypothetical protein n=1 Tax=uncultured Campylobacter sp. TaxID=218934 RepID=UPI002637DE13|nr:hypothetical protein [uncultured Campylobacter sp.]